MNFIVALNLYRFPPSQSCFGTISRARHLQRREIDGRFRINGRIQLRAENSYPRIFNRSLISLVIVGYFDFVEIHR